MHLPLSEIKKSHFIQPLWVIAVFVQLFFPGLSFSEEEPVGEVIGVSGTIEYRSALDDAPVANLPGGGEVQKVAFSPWKKVAFRQPIYEQDEFRTAEGSRLKIKFKDNSLIALGPNAKMKVEQFMFQKKDKLRQGVVNVSQGLSMYIFNKTQNNKKSTFIIKSPSGNLAARGTHGYVGVSDTRTLVGNQAGAVLTTSSDPTITAQVTVGAMQKNVIEQGSPPTPPTSLSTGDLNTFKTLVLGQITPTSTSQQNKKSLIEVQETSSDEADEDQEEDSRESQTQQSSQDKKVSTKEDSIDSSSSDKSPDSRVASNQTPGSDAGGDFSSALSQDFGGGTNFGTSGDFAQVNEPFDAAIVASCSR